MTAERADSPWLDALLREARPAALDDNGFSAGVLARIAATTTPALAPRAALAALRQTQRGERRYNCWTIGGTLVGAVVAAAAAWQGGAAGAVEATTPAGPGIALLVVSCSLAWWAIASKRDDALW